MLKGLAVRRPALSEQKLTGLAYGIELRTQPKLVLYGSFQHKRSGLCFKAYIRTSWTQCL